MSKTMVLAWQRSDFGAKIERLRRAYLMYWRSVSLPRERVRALSELSSTMYEVAGTASVKWNSRRPSTWVWGPLGLWSYLRMEAVSDLMWKLARKNEVPLSVDQLDIRQSIKRKRGRLEEAKRLIILALNGSSLLGESGHTYALLFVGLIEVTLLLEGGEKNEWAFAEAHRLGAEVVPLFEKTEPAQAARVYRALSEIDLRVGHPLSALVSMGMAECLAREHNLDDQLVKIEPRKRYLKTILHML